MAFKPVECRDETGQHWWVFEGDPAWPLVYRLWMHGVRDVVLPRATFVGGQLAVVSVPTTMAQWDVSNPTIAALLRRFVRLQDCCGWLEAQLGDSGLRAAGTQGAVHAVAAAQHHGAG